MQRAVTLNNKNERLWEEYLKFELQHAKDTSVPKIVYKHACQALPLSKAHFKALLHISN